ncbi:MAG: response regulator, partial [Oceanibaculum sp.]
TQKKAKAVTGATADLVEAAAPGAKVCSIREAVADVMAALPTPGAAAAAADRLPSPIQAGILAKSPFVVCIDDEAQVREGMQILLESWGCEVVTADSAEAALALVAGRGAVPDLLLIDLHLGDERADGLAEIETLRAAWGPHVPSVLITANRDPAMVLRARGLGLDVLHKPVKPAKLRALIAQRAAA